MIDATFVRQHLATLEAEGYRLANAEPATLTEVLEGVLTALTPLLPTCTKPPVMSFHIAAPDGTTFVIVCDIEADGVVRICEDADLTHPEMFEMVTA